MNSCKVRRAYSFATLWGRACHEWVCFVFVVRLFFNFPLQMKNMQRMDCFWSHLPNFLNSSWNKYETTYQDFKFEILIGDLSASLWKIECSEGKFFSHHEIFCSPRNFFLTTKFFAHLSGFQKWNRASRSGLYSSRVFSMIWTHAYERHPWNISSRTKLQRDIFMTTHRCGFWRKDYPLSRWNMLMKNVARQLILPGQMISHSQATSLSAHTFWSNWRTLTKRDCVWMVCPECIHSLMEREGNRAGLLFHLFRVCAHSLVMNF